MQLLIRRYRPSDKDTVRSLFSHGILEHIGSCFHNAMSSPLYVGITLGLFGAGYLLAGGSLLWALVAAGSWVALLYYSCYEVFASYVRKRLQTDMQDIEGSYLSRPNDCFWVAETEVNGRAEVMGMVAVMAKQSQNGETYGELFRMILSSSCRRMGLGSRMTQTVLDFCRERGFTKVALETSSTQTAAVALYEKMGFAHVHSHTNTEAPDWMTNLARVHIVGMERHLKA
ncbi:N-acetyltransferase 8-like 2 [Aplochiton taeniatus]